MKKRMKSSGTNRWKSMWAAAGLLAAACAVAAVPATDFVWRLPAGFHAPPVPAGNPMSAAKVELGRYLFYDRRMSLNGEGACATCHIQKYGFTNQLPVAIGVTGESHPRRVMPLANVAWLAVYNWANPEVTDLEEQSRTPMFHAHPLELGLDEEHDKFLGILRTDATYARLFPEAFAGEGEIWDFKHVRMALAAFERTLISGNSPYDRYRYGHEAGAISEAAKRGEDLFFHQPYACARCHGGFTFGGGTVYQTTDGAHGIEFMNNGIYNIAGKVSYPEENTGLYEFTHKLEDVGKFRPPSLRNVAVRAPYMHDGSMRTLDEVLDHYARGGRLIASGKYAGDGSKNPNKAEMVGGFPLTAGQRADLKAFLESLTDEGFLTDVRFGNPWMGR
jgi:cytochrome c peroxidase